MTDLPWYFIPAAMVIGTLVLIGMLTLYWLVSGLMDRRNTVQVSHRVVSKGRR